VNASASPYLGGAAPIPASDADGLQAPFWEGLKLEEVRVQRCRACRTWIFAPEWICHHCLSFDLAWETVEPEGRLYSWTRVWRGAGALAPFAPYLTVVVELPKVGNIRMIGNLLGDPHQALQIGAPAKGVFEHHPASQDPQRPAYSLLQWRLA
jgi:uncharacterized OB-fold protein